MTTQPEPFDLHSQDIAAARRAALLRLLPEIHTAEGKIDFERLKLALGEAVEVGKERYGLTWPGKAECFKTIQAPSLGTLRPCRAESVSFDSTENLIIEGDNLEVLKLLQKSYLGKVKLIYIDPPYNTGNDFVYPDNYRESLQTYLEYTQQADAEGRKFGTNTDADGRFHSKWLNMIYPRLYLARNLLCDDGVIFISINDTEVANLRKICDEIFGEENLVSIFVWNSSTAGGIRPKYVSQCHEYALMYARHKDALGELYAPLSPEAIEQYAKVDARGPYREKDFAWRNSSNNPNQRYPIRAPDGSQLWPPAGYLYRFVKATFEEAQQQGLVVFKETTTSPLVDEQGQPARYNIYIKKYLGTGEGAPASIPPRGLVGLSSRGSEELKALFAETLVFTNPKSTDYLKYLFTVGGDEQSIILDFFAGSGTTAHAVLDLNRQDGGNRKFILVQLPEPTGRSDYPTIAEITKERVRRVIHKLNTADVGKLDLGDVGGQDRGFRVFKLAESNFMPWNANVPHEASALARQLELQIDHIRPEREAEDLLYELLLKSGFALTTPVEVLTLAGQPVYSVADGALYLCLVRTITLDLIRAIAERQPVRVLCLDEGFAGHDQLKANAGRIFQSAGVTSFQTV
jgi:adenine-specific DNA-methyltransferase